MVSGEELRETMRRFAAGVSVVTASVDGQRFGVTVGSLVSLSLEPPLVGIAIGLQSSFHEPLREAGRFAVSLLAADQERIARHFARSGVPPIALWSGVPTHESDLAEPLVADALGWLACRTRTALEAGDHTIFVGDVLSTQLGREAGALVYVRGGYASA
jgi:flavin reductase (DIM6/NTAB) family NADH-FMN oxidoreductase RutF